MRVVAFFVPGIPPNGNALHRMGHWEVRKSRAAWAEVTDAGMVDAEILPWRGEPIQRATLDLLWRFNTRRARDLDNLIAGIKPIIDALVRSGILVSDDSEHLIGIAGRVEVVRGSVAGIVVSLREVEG